MPTKAYVESLQRRMHADVIIGIDPDVDRNGMAVLYKESRTLTVTTPSFPQLLQDIIGLDAATKATGRTLWVVVEAGWLNASNWHLMPYDTKQSAAAKGNATGRNHEVGRKIFECLAFHNISVTLVKPLRKCWSGKDGKITQQEIERVTNQKIGRTNQEGRDAALLAWNEAGYPIIVHTPDWLVSAQHRHAPETHRAKKEGKDKDKKVLFDN